MNNQNNQKQLPKLAIFGAGGLGQEMLKVLAKRPCCNLVAIVDKSGYLFDSEGLEPSAISAAFQKSQQVASLSRAKVSSNAITDLMVAHGNKIDAIFYALPNIPNNFLKSITENILSQSGFDGVIVDAIKRTSALKDLAELNNQLQENNVLYIAGCGATPGMLTSAAAIASQSFVEIQSVKITFGVGIANWQAYRATVREDIAHMQGFSVDTVAAMSEAEIDAELEKRNGLLELVNMEHADDIMLELAGICSADKVTVGGFVDTRNPQKPVSTMVEITGLTYNGKVSTTKFVLGDETNMAANVNGTVLGFINAGIEAKQTYKMTGFKTALQLMPKFSPTLVSRSASMNEEAAKEQILASK